LPAKSSKSWVYWIGLLVAAIGLVALINGVIHLGVGQAMRPPMPGPMMGQEPRGMPGGPMPGAMAPYFVGLSWLRSLDRIVFGAVFLAVGVYMMLAESKRS